MKAAWPRLTTPVKPVRIIIPSPAIEKIRILVPKSSRVDPPPELSITIGASMNTASTTR